MIYLGRFAISIIVMVISSVCLQHFVEAKNQYDRWMEGMEPANHYYAERPEEGLTEEELQELGKIEGVKSVEKTTYINCSTMQQDMQEIKISSPTFQGSEYVDTQRKYSQKMQGIPLTKGEDYFSIVELSGISGEDEEQLLYYEKKADIGSINRERFLAGEECVLFLMPYQLKDFGAGKEVSYITESEKDSSKKVYMYEMDDHKIAPGDTLTIQTPWGEKNVQIGAIITEQNGELATNAVVLGVSDAFINQICGFEEPRYTEVKINLDDTMDTTKAGERIEGYFETLEQGAGNLTNEIHAVHEFAETSLFEEAQYLFILTTIWLIYMLIMYHGNQIYLKNEGKRIGVLRTLGMDKIALRGRYLLENLCEGVAIILISLVIVVVEFLIRLRKQAPYDSISSLHQSLSSNPETMRLFGMTFVIAMLVFLGVTAVTLYVPLKKMSKESIIENLKE